MKNKNYYSSSAKFYRYYYHTPTMPGNYVRYLLNLIGAYLTIIPFELVCIPFFIGMKVYDIFTKYKGKFFDFYTYDFGISVTDKVLISLASYIGLIVLFFASIPIINIFTPFMFNFILAGVLADICVIIIICIFIKDQMLNPNNKINWNK